MLMFFSRPLNQAEVARLYADYWGEGYLRVRSWLRLELSVATSEWLEYQALSDLSLADKALIDIRCLLDLAPNRCGRYLAVRRVGEMTSRLS